MKLGMLKLQRQGDIENVTKRVDHHACFHATMLRNTDINMTFGDLRAQQTSTIIF